MTGAKLLAAAVAALALGAAGEAGQHTGQQTGQQTGQAPTTRPPVAGGAVIGVQVRELAMVATGYRATKVLNKDVYNEKNEKVGKVDDLIITPDGRLSYGILEVGGFLGMGERRVAIPVGQFASVEQRKITLPGATKDALKQLPEFRYAPKQEGVGGSGE